MGTRAQTCYLLGVGTQIESENFMRFVLISAAALLAMPALAQDVSGFREPVEKTLRNATCDDWLQMVGDRNPSGRAMGNLLLGYLAGATREFARQGEIPMQDILDTCKKDMGQRMEQVLMGVIEGYQR